MSSRRPAIEQADRPLDSGNWRKLGEIIADKKAEVEAAIRARDEETAAAAHDDLVNIERQERVIETVRGYR